MPGIKAAPDESNARYFHVVVDGPKDVSETSNVCVVVCTRHVLQTGTMLRHYSLPKASKCFSIHSFVSVSSFCLLAACSNTCVVSTSSELLKVCDSSHHYCSFVYRSIVGRYGKGVLNLLVW